MRISDLKIGQSARVLKLAVTDRLYRQKLIAMGIIPGTLVQMAGIAPLGDPIEIKVRGVMVCLRKEEANIIQIEEI
jgi:ferrous iron transport protein A